MIECDDFFFHFFAFFLHTPVDSHDDIKKKKKKNTHTHHTPSQQGIRTSHPFSCKDGFGSTCHNAICAVGVQGLLQVHYFFINHITFCQLGLHHCSVEDLYPIPIPAHCIHKEYSFARFYSGYRRLFIHASIHVLHDGVDWDHTTRFPGCTVPTVQAHALQEAVSSPGVWPDRYPSWTTSATIDTLLGLLRQRVGQCSTQWSGVVMAVHSYLRERLELSVHHLSMTVICCEL